MDQQPRQDRSIRPTLAIGAITVTVVIAALLLCLMALALTWLRSRDTIVPTRGEAEVTCTTANGEELVVEARNVQAAFYSVAGEVIISGPAPQIEQVVSELPERGIELQAEVICDLGFIGRLSRSSNLDQRGFPYPLEARRNLAMNLYKITSRTSIDQVVQAVNAQGLDRYVYADPNYLTGLLGQSQCSAPKGADPSPHEPVGSPHEPVGSPHEPVGSPSGTGREAAPELFRKQWALEQIGLDPALRAMPGLARDLPSGSNVRVGVFDTAPWDNQQSAAPTTLVLDQVTPTLDLAVIPWPRVSARLTASASATDVRDHGVFVAGLVHAVAPESEIQLVQVLDSYGCGDLFTLNRALYQFIADTVNQRNRLDGAVINLSLGVLKPRTAEAVIDAGTGDIEEPQDERQQQVPENRSAMVQVEEDLMVLVEDSIESLEAAVLLAYDRGVVVVAAAGNDSYLAYRPLAPHLPAAYPSVIGVAGNNIRRERACFSNWGDVYAPSGDGGPDGELTCGSVVASCQGDCQWGVVSLSPTSSTTGYAYWSGTSFAAPLVSGLAALTMDKGGSQKHWVEPNDVFSAIRCGAPTGDGVINVPATLFRCLP